MGERRLCYGCMDFKSSDDAICPFCGYADDTPFDPNYIEPGTILSEKYVIGSMIGANSEGATYIGYNQSIGCRVLIREYMPQGLCSRVRGKSTISVDPKCVVQYKAMMSEFADLNKSLAHMRNVAHINPTLDLFTANNTTYAVSEYLEGITLVDYLKENAGELTWKQVSEMFPTFFTTLSLLHNNGIIHRAISPETIYVTERNVLRLCAFSISDVRTVQSELPCEIFHGYAAPEQYAANTRQGTWTDVYGICAVLYRILTGCKPTDAPSRMQNDNLCAPHEMNPNIPKHVSRVIMRGLSLYSDDRIKTVTELVTELFDQPEEPEIPKPIPPENPQRAKHRAASQQDNRRRQPQFRDYDEGGYEDGSGDSFIDRIKIPLIVGVLLICVLLVIAIIVMNLLDMNPPPQEPAVVHIETTVSTTNVPDVVTETNPPMPTLDPEFDSTIPDLIGKNFEMKKQQLETDGWLYLEAEYEYSDDYKAGVIMGQSKPKGTPFKSGSTIKVTVSKGPSSIKLPDYKGKTLKQYEAELEELGLTNYNTEAVVNYKYDNNTVIELSRDAGERFELDGTETLKIYYVNNPPKQQQTRETYEELPDPTFEELDPPDFFGDDGETEPLYESVEDPPPPPQEDEPVVEIHGDEGPPMVPVE
ncbi:MAG: PASTA domain-containing protein [Oscillospiraceae bacterium]|nr:PASTA domain-containing protein [Oscillospiraceae bacterium]